MDAELRWTLVSSLAARGAADQPEIEAAMAADPSSTGLVREAAVRASRPTAAAKKEAWARMADPDVSNEELLTPYLPGLPKFFDHLLANRGAEFTVQLGGWLPLSLSPSVQLTRVCRKNLARQDLEPVLRRIFSDLLEDTDRFLRARLLDEEDSTSE